jgi:hypothetical protein
MPDSLTNIGEYYLTWSVRRLSNDTSGETTTAAVEIGGNYIAEISADGSGSSFTLDSGVVQIPSTSDVEYLVPALKVSGGQGGVRGTLTVAIWGEIA